MTDAMVLRVICALISLQCFALAGWIVWRYRQRKVLERKLIELFMRKRRVVQEHFLRIEDGPEEQRDTIPDKPKMGFRGA